MKRVIVQILLYLLLLGGVVGVIFLSGLNRVWLNLPFFLLSLWIIPSWHETGHLLFGKAVGMKLMQMDLPGFAIRKKEGKWRVKPVFSSVSSCAMYPESIEGACKKHLIFALGGVAFNAIYLAICLTLLIVFNQPYLWATLGMTLPYNLYIFLLNLLPWTSDEGDFDGAVIFGLLKNDVSQQVATNILVIQGKLFCGHAPAEIEKSLFFDVPQLPEDESHFSMLQYLRYCYYADGGDKAQAIKAITRLEDCTEYISPVFLPTVYAELTYVYTCLNVNEELAERYMNRLQQAKKTESSEFYRALFAYGKMFGVADWCDEAKKKMPAAIQEEELAGMAKFQEKLWKEIV
ncbi:MAG: hypothetical protein J6Z36_01185 [Clostridia bacterium]|nr:hypothetical protein [Clostridia bacterium]